MKIIYNNGTVAECPQEEELQVIRHTAAHILAQAVKNLYPQAHFAYGPATEKGFHYAWENLCKGMEDILARNGKTFADVRSVGVSCGGPLDSRRGLVLSPPNLPGWDEMPMPKMIRRNLSPTFPMISVPL